MAIEVHTERLKRRFVADYLSVACLLNTLIVLGAAILPLYISWASSLWIRDKVVFEQIDVEFNSRIVVQADGYRGIGGARAPFSALWSTSPVANSLYGAEASRAMVAQLTPMDRNADGIMDEATLSVDIPLGSDESIHAVTVVAFVKSRLHTSTRMTMDSALIGHASSGLPLQRIHLDGDARLVQRDTLPRPAGGVYVPYMTTPLQGLDAAVSVEQVLPSAFISTLRARNYSLAYDVPSPVLEVDVSMPKAGADVSPAAAWQGKKCTVTMLVRVPVAPIAVRASIPEELKWGWMQYLSFLAITLLLADWLRTALFGWRLVDTTVLVDAPRAATKLHTA